MGVVLHIHGEEVCRNYSVSDAPDKHCIQISVKREPDGVVSSYSGGAEVTPTISMLNTCVTSGREIIFIHAVLNS